MKIVFTVEVGIDVSNYRAAGEILDHVRNALEMGVGPNGYYDFTNFRSDHHRRPQEPVSDMQAEVPEYSLKASTGMKGTPYGSR